MTAEPSTSKLPKEIICATQHRATRDSQCQCWNLILYSLHYSDQKEILSIM